MPSVILFTYPLVLLASVVSLVLSAEAVRRIRRINQGAVSGGAPMPPSGPDVGATLPAFDARTVEGEPVTAVSFATGRSAVGFFGATCQPCRDHLPNFLADLSAGAFDQGLVVVVGDPAAGADLVSLARAADVAVLVEPDNGAISAAYAIQMFPTVVAVNDGTVVDVGQKLRPSTLSARPLVAAP
jgi:hypothetical protein